MEAIELLIKKSKQIEKLKDELFELEHGIEGAEVLHEGNPAVVMEVDWDEKAVLLNYDDIEMEWVSFE